MTTRVVCVLLTLMLVASVAAAQTMTPMVYSLPNTGGSAQWVAIGTFNANQQGYDINVQIVSSNGYNAAISQDQVTYVQFKSSNANSVNATGFAGDSWWYQTGPNVSAPSQVVWVANASGISATAFTLYAYFGMFTGSDSYYVVNVPPGTSWTNLAAGGKSNPGSASPTVLVAQNQYFIGSTTSFASGIVFADGSTQTTAFNPSAPISITGSLASGGSVAANNGNLSASYSGANNGGVGPALSLVNPAKTSPGTANYWNIYNMNGAYGNSLEFWDYDTIGCTTGGMCNPRLTILDGGNVGIGTTNPTATLEINGNVKIDGNLYFGSNTTPQSAPYAGCTGGDYAESVNVSGDYSKFEPGDVLVIAPDSSGDVVRSTEPYSTLVVGIYSTKPGVVGRRQTTAKGPDEIPMAMLGIVPTKVSAENGPIRRGDLLVTSSNAGYAMKGTDSSRMTGAVVGKALGSLDSGIGVIEVVVTLQ